MAITLSGITTAVQDTGLITTANVTKVVSSQSTNTFVFVVISCHKQGSYVYESPTSVTYDSVAMTQLDSETNTQGGLSIWYIQNAAVGSGDIQANWGSNMLYTRLVAFSATGCHATDAIANSDSATASSMSDGLMATLTATNTWTNSKILGFGMSYVNNRTYDMDFGGTETSFYAYSTTNKPDTGYLIKHQGSYITSSGGSVSLTRTLNNISDTGNNVYLSFLAFELRSADGSAVLDLSSNMKMTSSIALGRYKSFLSNIVLISIFTKTKTFAKVFLENVVLMTTFLRDILITFTSNLVMTSSFVTMASKKFTSIIKLTSSFSTLFISYFLKFTSNIVISPIIRIIYGGIRVGIWNKVVKKTASWTATAKNSTIWNKIYKND